MREKVILEAERKSKLFQLIRVKGKKEVVSETKQLELFEREDLQKEEVHYEMRWKNASSQRWGRTIVKEIDNSPVSQSRAFEIFFDALESSEKMNFIEL